MNGVEDDGLDEDGAEAEDDDVEDDDGIVGLAGPIPDEDEDDEDDEEFSDDDEVEETVVLCSLTPGKVSHCLTLWQDSFSLTSPKIEQSQLNLTFIEGDAVMFEVTGEK